MVVSKIRSLRQLKTYLCSPEKGSVQRHVIVDTTRFEGYNPDDNYDEGTETMAFPTWCVYTNPDDILVDTDSSKGMYKMHNDAVKEFQSRGYRRIKTKLVIQREEFMHGFSIELVKRLFGVNSYSELTDHERKKLDSLQNRIIRLASAPLVVTDVPK